MADRDRNIKNSHQIVVQEILFRIKTEQESGSGLGSKVAKELVLRTLDREYIQALKPGGWTAHSLKEYCSDRQDRRELSTRINDPEPTLDDLVYEGDREVECRFCPGV